MKALLCLPPRSAQVSYRAYADSSLGECFLAWALRRFSSISATRGFDVLYFDRADADALGLLGRYGFASQGTLVGGLAEYAAVLGTGDDTLVFPLEAALLPEHVLHALAAEQAAHRADATTLSGWRSNPGLTAFRNQVLAALPGKGIPPDLDPFRYLSHLAALRAASARPPRLRRVPIHRVLPQRSVPPVPAWLSWEDAARLALVTRDPGGIPADHDFQTSTGFGSLAQCPLPPLAEDDARHRVLYVTPVGGYSGAEASLCELAGAMDSQRFQLMALAGAEGHFTRNLKSSGCEVFAANFDLTTPGPLTRRWPREALGRIRPHIIHANSYLGAPLLRALRESGVPWIQHVRNTEFGILLESMHRAQAVVAISRFIETHLVQAGIPREKIHCIPNGVDTARFRRALLNRAVARWQFQLDPSAFVAIVVARCVRWKRLELAIEAVAHAVASGTNVQLFLVSDREDSEYRTELEARIARLGIGSHVRWTGFQEDIRHAMIASDALVLPSDHEAFGRCVIEAMSLGIPAIVSDNGGAMEAVEHGTTGFVISAGDSVELAQPLVALARNPQLASRMGRSARDHAIQHWDSRWSASRMESLYLALLDGVSFH